MPDLKDIVNFDSEAGMRRGELPTILEKWVNQKLEEDHLKLEKEVEREYLLNE